ncbi:MAG: DinB family protein [Betaproteobacteria bacterium]
MITPGYASTMARYNRWQNESLFREAGRLSDDERRLQRGAFFGSINGTLNHIYWGDCMWLSRFGVVDRPRSPNGKASIDEFPRFEDLAAARPVLDAKIIAWADALTPEVVARDLIWWSGLQNKNMSRPTGLAIAHIFNHQTHHRGQVHAMLTAAGAKPDDTDVVFMPGVVD